MKKRFFTTLLALAAITATSFSQIKLPGIFSDNLVLQQNSEVVVWGWAGPAEKVKIVASWNSSDTITATTNNQSKWMAKIKTVKAGGPFTLTFTGSNRIELQNVMLGEVWICSGQSNMEWSVNHGIKDGEAEAAKANHPNLRFFHVPKIGSETPQDDCKATWSVCTPETMRSTSAIGYFYGRELMQKLNVPVGLIISAWGGTPAEVWLEKERVEKDPVLYSNRYDKEYEWWPGAPGITWNAMIHPLVPYGIAGAIWYQGESNSSKPIHYAKLMQALIDNWREAFGKQFPFYWVQIAPFEYGDINEKAYLIREQQTNMLSIPNTGMVIVSDLVDNVKDIHPKNKTEVGKRLATLALNENYGIKAGEYKNPMFESVVFGDGKIMISFTNAADGLTCTTKSPEKFMVAGENQVFMPAQAKIEGNSVVVFSKYVKIPVAVRYCFDNATLPDVFNKAGLPLAPFRTDSW
jgi:sialate O-acetylesterase